MSSLLIRHNLSVPNLQSYYTALWSDDQASFSSSQARGWLTDLEMVGREWIGDTEIGWGSVLVHRAVVLPLLPHLAMLSQATGEREDSKVVFTDVPLEVIKSVVQLIYTGQCNLSPVSTVMRILDMMKSLGLFMQPDSLDVLQNPVTRRKVISGHIAITAQENAFCHKEALMDETIENVISMANRFADETAAEEIVASKDDPQKSQDKVKSFKCDVCKKTFARNNLEQPMAIHKGIKFCCSECESSFSREPKLKEHQKNKQKFSKKKVAEIKQDKNKSAQAESQNIHTFKHPEDESVSTTASTSAVKDNKDLSRKDENCNSVKRVVKNKSEEQRFFCEHCDFKCRFFRQLIEHSGVLHSESMFSCENCDFKSKSLINIKMHRKRVHIGAGKYKCDVCEYKALNPYKLELHKKFHHEKRFKKKQIKKLKKSASSREKEGVRGQSRACGWKLKPEGFYCHVCDFKPMFSKSLERHLKRFHEGNL
eukprot:GFUD01027206.1.p1 GENE.GFUD01027206.1~~GFUD01027206.1.p1  ORF type:complete len:482 (-),score=128.17 GFUD01027206.1:32-1477(-)